MPEAFHIADEGSLRFPGGSRVITIVNIPKIAHTGFMGYCHKILGAFCPFDVQSDKTKNYAGLKKKITLLLVVTYMSYSSSVTTRLEVIIWQWFFRET